MGSGRWLPISKALLSELPSDRAFTRLEAMFSLTADYDEGNTATIKGYSVQWGWSQGKVRRFMEEVGASLSYPQNTAVSQNQRGEIVIQMSERSSDKKGQIKIIDSKWLASQTERPNKPDGEKSERPRVTTMNPNPKLKKEERPSPPLQGEEQQGTPPEVIVFSEPVMWISNDLARLVLANNPKNRELQGGKMEATVLRWAKDIDKMIRLDAREPREVAEVVRWCQRDSFWSQNILSGVKLREQYDKLILKMKGAVHAVVSTKPTKETRLQRNAQACIDAARMLGIVEVEEVRHEEAIELEGPWI